jgi:hypothetical protein
MSAVASLRHRIDPTPAMALVALVDLALIGTFVVVGELTHNINPLTSPLVVADTYAQFLIGWVVTSVLGGLYTDGALVSTKRAVAWTAPAWIGAAAIAQVVRATPLFHGNADVAFFLVSSAVGLVLLVPWRVALARFSDL